MIDLEEIEDADTVVPRDEVLAQVAELARQQVILEDEVADLERMLDSRKEDLRKVSHDLLPAALAEVGLGALALVDGSSLTVKAYYQASIPEQFREEAFGWLRSRGHGDLVKHELKATFGKGEDADAIAARDALALLGVPFSDKETVHPMTLKAFIREQVEAGADVPLETFGAHIGQRTYIKRR